MTWPGEKNEVLPPSGAVTVGFSDQLAAAHGRAVGVEVVEPGAVRAERLAAERGLAQVGRRRPPRRGPDPDRVGVGVVAERGGIVCPAGRAELLVDQQIHVLIIVDELDVSRVRPRDHLDRDVVAARAGDDELLDRLLDRDVVVLRGRPDDDIAAGIEQVDVDVRR